jgi:hypothetical protein
MKISTNQTILSNKTYDVLKYIAQIVLPALGALYFALSQIWGFPNGEEVVGTIVAIDVFLGALLGVSTKQYKKSGAKYAGTLDIFEDEDTKQFNLQMDEDPYELDKKSEVTFRVNSSDNPS